MRKINPNKMSRDRQLLLMLAIRMRKAGQRYSATLKSSEVFYEVQAQFIEANNAYQTANAMYYNYKNEYPKMSEANIGRCKDCVFMQQRFSAKTCDYFSDIVIHSNDFCSNYNRKSENSFMNIVD